MYEYKPVSVAESADARVSLTLKKLLLFRLNNPAAQIYLHKNLLRYLSAAELIGNAGESKEGLLPKNVLYKSGNISLRGSQTVTFGFKGGLFLFRSSYHNMSYSLYYANNKAISKISWTYDYDYYFDLSYSNETLSVTNKAAEETKSIQVFFLSLLSI